MTGLDTGDPSLEAPRRFRPDLEGLRGVAVVLVLLYHARVPGFPGGYVGVDVFFVLSGFLITRLLIRELRDTGRIAFGAFYARRARRLLPVAALVVAVTLAASAVMLAPLQAADVANDAVASALYASNIRFGLLATDYLASELPPSPLLHFWSLGVEEQFYLVWPALLMVTCAAAFASGDPAKGLRRVGLVLAIVLAGSLVASVWLTDVSQPWAFFSLPTRAWELALGGILALPVVMRLWPERLARPGGWVGLAAVVAAGVFLTESTPFPGTAAILPTVGAGLLIAAGLGSVSPTGRSPRWTTGPAAVLSVAPLRFLGRISYSLYLWHWPILVLPALALGSEIQWPGRMALLVLAIVVSAASQRWVEEPIRHGRIVGTRPSRTLWLAAALTVMVGASGLGAGALAARGLAPSGPIVGGTTDEIALPSDRPGSGPGASAPGASVTPGPPTPLPTLRAAPLPADLAPALASARDDLPIIYADDCHLSVAETVSPPCIYGDIAATDTVVLYGDSHAAQWFPALERISKDRGFRLVVLTKSACPSADVPIWSLTNDRRYVECDTWRAAAEARIVAERPAMVILSNARHYSIDLDGGMAWSTDHESVWSAGLAQTIASLSPTAGSIVVISDTVRMAVDPLPCLSEHLENMTLCATPHAEAVAIVRSAMDQDVASSTGATFIDPTTWQCVTESMPGGDRSSAHLSGFASHDGHLCACPGVPPGGGVAAREDRASGRSDRSARDDPLEQLEIASRHPLPGCGLDDRRRSSDRGKARRLVVGEGRDRARHRRGYARFVGG